MLSLQDFFTTNQFKDKQTLNEYFASNLDKAETTRRVDHELIPSLEETLKAEMC